MNSQFPVIYKRTATGAVQQWRAEVDGTGQFRTVYGQVGGAEVITEWTRCETTNGGKKNARGPIEQAVFEVQSMYKKKLEKEYHKSVEDIDQVLVRLPMLAKDYKEHKKKINFKTGVWIQPKLDGIRATVCSKMIQSRNGKELFGMPHILEALAPVFDKYPDIVFDGELYNHEYKSDFDSICSAVKKKNCSLEDIMKAREVIQYHVYDIFNGDGGYHERSTLLAKINEEFFVQGETIQLVATYLIQNENNVEHFYEQFLEDGFEGAMIRLESDYVNKRTDKLLKRKEFIDEEFVVIDILEGLGNWSGYAKSALLELGDGRTFSAGIKGTQQQMKDLLVNRQQYIGKPATVKYFAKTPSGIPRFPVIKEFNRTDNL